MKETSNYLCKEGVKTRRIQDRKENFRDDGFRILPHSRNAFPNGFFRFHCFVTFIIEASSAGNEVTGIIRCSFGH
jgi:hypothetical protein